MRLNENIKTLDDLEKYVVNNYFDKISDLEKEIILFEFYYLKLYEIKFKKNIINEINNLDKKLNKKIYLFKLLNLIDNYEGKLSCNINDYDIIETEYHPPDVDIDITDKNRNEIINFIANKFNNNVAIIGAYNTFDLKNSILDILRVFGVPFELAVSISKKINKDNPDWDKEFINLCEENEKIKTYFENAKEFLKNNNIFIDNIYEFIINFIKRIKNNVRQLTEHASGILITEKTIYENIPIRIKNNNKCNYLTEYDLEAVEKCNFLKIDLLALRTLSIIIDTINLIKKYENKDIDLYNIDLNDKNLYETINKCLTAGIFQFQTDSAKTIIKIIKPKNFKEIVVVTSLNRPGTKNMIDEYLLNKPSSNLDIINKHTKETNYIVLFQEQVNKIISEFLNITEGEADLIRRQFEKIKNENDLEKLYVEFLEKSPHSKKETDEIFRYLYKYAGYLFNKSHAVAYSILTLQTAYLKTYYPLYFFCSCLNNPAKNIKENIFNELKYYNYELVFPDINISLHNDFIIDNINSNRIYYALGKIKGLTEETSLIIIKNRPFSSYFDFLKKMYKHKNKINKAKIEILIRCDTLRSFSNNQKALLETYNIIENMLKKKENVTEEFVLNLLKEKEKEVKDFTKKQKEEYYNEYLNIIFNPLCDIYSLKEIDSLEKNKVYLNYNNLYNLENNSLVTVIGLIVNIKELYTKKGDAMAFVEILDYFNNKISIAFFPQDYKKYKEELKLNKIISCIIKINDYLNNKTFSYFNKFIIIK